MRRFLTANRSFLTASHNNDTKALSLAVSLMAVLSAYRFYAYWSTGFFTSDEYGYYYDAVHGAVYSDRWFVGLLNIYVFKAFGITNVDAFSFMLPFYMFFWASVTFIVFYKLLKLMGFDQRTIALSLVSCFALISFVLLSLGFLTEPVGLCLAMCGIYCLARYTKARTVRGLIGFTGLSAVFFGLAAGTREPYNAFLIGGVVIMALAAVTLRRAPPERGWRPPRSVVLTSIALFAIVSLFFLFVPTHAYTQQVAPLSTQLAQSIGSIQPTQPPPATTVTTTVTTSAVISHTTTTFTTTHTTTSVQSVPLYRHYVITNTFLIFLGGVVLGWGPICFGIGLAGFAIVLRRSLQGKDITARFMVVTSLVALGSYFVVSFIYAPDPYYFSFQDYSTVIRFSDTALPAYFMSAPFFLARFYTRRRVAALVAVVLIFLVAAIPVYESYAASNFSSLQGENPFALGYRTPAVAIRDYFDSVHGLGTTYIAGLPYGWVFTPGVQDLKQVHAYTLVDNGQAPYLAVSNFTAYHWGAFYVYSSTPQDPASDLPAFLRVPLLAPSNSSYPYTVSSSRLVLNDSDFALLYVTMVWH